jgi:hypothetical protein
MFFLILKTCKGWEDDKGLDFIEVQRKFSRDDVDENGKVLLLQNDKGIKETFENIIRLMRRQITEIEDIEKSENLKIDESKELSFDGPRLLDSLNKFYRDYIGSQSGVVHCDATDDEFREAFYKWIPLEAQKRFFASLKNQKGWKDVIDVEAKFNAYNREDNMGTALKFTGVGYAFNDLVFDLGRELGIENPHYFVMIDM